MPSLTRLAFAVILVSVCLPVLLAVVLSSMTLRQHIYEPSTKPHLGELDPPRDLSMRKWKIFQHFTNPRHDLGLDYKDVTFDSWDDPQVKLRGWFIPAQEEYTVSIPSEEDPNAQRLQKLRVGIVAVHGAFVDRREFLRHAKWMHPNNLNLLMFDCREHGASDGTGQGISLTVREHADALAAARYMKRNLGMDRVVLLGVSQGAASSIVAAGKDTQGLIDMVIAEAPFSHRYKVLQYSMELAINKGWAGGKKITDTLPGRLAYYFLNTERFKDTIIGVGLYRMGAIRLKDILDPSRAQHLIENPIDVVDRISPRPLMLIHAVKDHIVLLEESKMLYERAKEPKVLEIFERGIHGDILNDHGEEYEEAVLSFIRNYLK